MNALRIFCRRSSFYFHNLSFIFKRRQMSFTAEITQEPLSFPPPFALRPSHECVVVSCLWSSVLCPLSCSLATLMLLTFAEDGEVLLTGLNLPLSSTGDAMQTPQRQRTKEIPLSTTTPASGARSTPQQALQTLPRPTTPRLQPLLLSNRCTVPSKGRPGRSGGGGRICRADVGDSRTTTTSEWRTTTDRRCIRRPTPLETLKPSVSSPRRSPAPLAFSAKTMASPPPPTKEEEGLCTNSTPCHRRAFHGCSVEEAMISTTEAADGPRAIRC